MVSHLRICNGRKTLLSLGPRDKGRKEVMFPMGRGSHSIPGVIADLPGASGYHE